MSMPHDSLTEISTMELPPRRMGEDLASVRKLVAGTGHDEGVEIEARATADWSLEYAFALKVKATRQWTQEQFQVFLGRLHERHQGVWKEWAEPL